MHRSGPRRAVVVGMVRCADLRCIDLIFFVLLLFAFVNFLFSFIIIVRDVTVIDFDGSVVVVIILIFIVYPLQTILIDIDARKKKR